ncbi:hypothetical protein BGX23_004482 [Mortierella sp. AD031]|nr:hypothetical protein BGX23_004482 [Mortierella sp. AD031]
MYIDAPSSTTAAARPETAAQTYTSRKQRKPYTKSSTSSSSSSSTAQKPSSRGVRMTFELDDVLRKYTPEEFKTCKGYDVGGVNILNKKPLDSKTALDKITRRRETHNRVERRRRDYDDSLSKGHRVNVLRNVVGHIQNLSRQNESLNKQLRAIQTGTQLPPPTIITTPAHATHYEDNSNNNDASVIRNSPSPSPSYASLDFRSHPSPESSSPRFGPSYQHYFTPLQPPGSESLNAINSTDSSRVPSPSPLPSLSEMVETLPSIPKIPESVG